MFEIKAKEDRERTFIYSKQDLHVVAKFFDQIVPTLYRALRTVEYSCT